MLSFDSKSKFIEELKQRQKEQLEFRGQELSSKIETIKVCPAAASVFAGGPNNCAPVVHHPRSRTLLCVRRSTAVLWVVVVVGGGVYGRREG